MWIHLLTLALISGASPAGDTTPPVIDGDGGGYYIKGDKPWWRKPAPTPEPLPRAAQKRARAIVLKTVAEAFAAENVGGNTNISANQFETLAGQFSKHAEQFWQLQLRYLGDGISKARATAELQARVVAEFHKINQENAVVALLLL